MVHSESPFRLYGGEKRLADLRSDSVRPGREGGGLSEQGGNSFVKQRLMRIDGNGAVGHIRVLEIDMDTSMKGKTVLFTGASRGMGRFAAIELARRGAEIIVVGHNRSRGEAAIQAIRGIGASATFLQADMADATEVRALAERTLALNKPINVLIHSAGGLQPAGALSPDGADRGFAQNFLGPFLLTRLLEDRLLASAPARVIAVGSSTHRMVKSVDVDAFVHPSKDFTRMSSFEKGGYQMLSYQVSKLAVTTWIYGLARRWSGRGVTANLLDPAMVKGEFGKEYEGPTALRFVMTVLTPAFMAAGTERGSEQYVRLAADPALANVTGMYFVSGKEKPQATSRLSLDPAVQKQIEEAAEAWAAPLLRAPITG